MLIFYVCTLRSLFEIVILVHGYEYFRWFYEAHEFRYCFSRNKLKAVCLIETPNFRLQYSAVLHKTWPLNMGFLYNDLYKPFIMAYFSLSTANIEWCQDHRILHIRIRHCRQIVPFFPFFFCVSSSGSMWT